jgi:hypothetical protein
VSELPIQPELEDPRPIQASSVSLWRDTTRHGDFKTSQGADSDAARVRALVAYKDFFTLWKDADPDIPILLAAKTEYAKLQ